MKSIAEIELEARAHGLSYGRYVAGVRLEKEREEAAARRQAEIRAMRAAEKAQKRKRGRFANGRVDNSCAVEMIDDEGRVLRRFPSQKAAAEATGMLQGSIHNSCMSWERYLAGKGKLGKTKKGYRWRFAGDSGNRGTGNG